jgi:hypothetical protein
LGDPYSNLTGTDELSHSSMRRILLCPKKECNELLQGNDEIKAHYKKHKDHFD